MRRSRSVRIKGQTLTIEGHNGEEDMMGKVTWLPVQELIKGESRENSRGRKVELRQNFESRERGVMSCYNCGKPGHMLRDCREAKCFGCGKLGHITPYCPDRQERLRCAGCGRFEQRRNRGMNPNALNVRTIEREREEEGRAINIGELEEKNMELPKGWACCEGL
ncbi:zinc finger CCHC domain-containing protein 9-like [Gordionus sp. m RMFG-2023]|uniref:zinc finger CCHC domain-containing protein 9-like n=1 Tax=Gordionus sp. m RMFG-2023 TaxID=3053472 RepID=UPI0031FCFE15